MTLKKSIAAVIGISVLTSSAGATDTRNVINELQNTPITAFDLGLYSLKRALKERFFDVGIELEMPEKQRRQYLTGAGYNPQSGVLTVFAIGYDFPPIPPSWDFTSECDQFLLRMRLELGYNPVDGKLYKRPSPLMDHFLDNVRNSMSGDIAEVTRIALHRQVGGQQRECSGALMSSGQEISE